VKFEIPETFQVGAIIAKLPGFWKGYRKKILHNSEDFSLEDIQKHLRIKEESRARDKIENSYDGSSKANDVDNVDNSNKFKKKGKFLGPRKDQGKFKNKAKGPCYVCGKPEHYAKDCRHRKQHKKEGQVNSIDEIIATVSEINAIQGKVSGWWYDTCATIHVCYDKSLFKTYHDIEDNQEIQMGNEGRSKVIGKGNVELLFTSGKKITLTNVLHVPEMNRNLASGVLLGKLGIKSVFEFGKLVLTHSGHFVGKGYSTEGMVKLCTVENNSNKIKSFAYVIDSFNLWH
ncbi:wall-associated receptor kinase 2, partial [Olea europaea subsp. europaea]